MSFHQETSLKLPNIKGALIAAHSPDTNSLIHHICFNNAGQEGEKAAEQEETSRRAPGVNFFETHGVEEIQLSVMERTTNK